MIDDRREKMGNDEEVVRRKEVAILVNIFNTRILYSILDIGN